MNSDKTIIQAQGLNKVYESAGENTQALKDVSISIRQGESLAIVGKSGSGKSTLMHILATLDKPSSGTLVIDDENVEQMNSSELDSLRNQKFGFVFQQFFLNGRNTCLENVMLPLTIMGMASAERKQRAREMLEIVGLADKENQRSIELSGGQKQRLCIARALVTKPNLIFADEPTGNLDSENGKHITELLFKLQKEEGITLVIVTHDADLSALCDRSITIKDGEIVSQNVKMGALA